VVVKCNRQQRRAFFFAVRLFNCKAGQGVVALAECNRMGLEVLVLRVVIGLKGGWGCHYDKAVVGYLCR
jgi:hypothetical protein